MSRVNVSINEKDVFLFSHDLPTSPIGVDSDSDFISKRVPGIRSRTKHLSRFYRLGHPKAAGPCNAIAGEIPCGPRARITSAKKASDVGCQTAAIPVFKDCDLETVSYPHAVPIKGLVDEIISS